MGDSGRRNACSTALFSDDVVAVMDPTVLGADTVVVGHSLGGAVALTLGVRHAGRVRGVVMLDSAMLLPDQPSPFDPTTAPIRPKTVCARWPEGASIGRYWWDTPQV